MRNKTQFAFLAATIFFLFGNAGVFAQQMATPAQPSSTTPTSLNNIRIGQCADSDLLRQFIAWETTRGLVIDARPFAINQTTGKTSFSGSDAWVAVVHTNPFIYNYKISVAQEELVSTALTDFLKLLLPESLTKIVGPESGGANLTSSNVTPTSKLNQIAKRLRQIKKPAGCTTACTAIDAMYEVFNEINNKELIKMIVAQKESGADKLVFATIPKGKSTDVRLISDPTFSEYTKRIGVLSDEEADASKVCNDVTALHTYLNDFKDKFGESVDQLDEARRAIDEVNVLATDLEELAVAFEADADLKAGGKDIRCQGFNCVDQLNAYALTVRSVLGTYNKELDRLRENVKEMKNTYLLTEQMKSKDGLFARSFSINKKFELSQATISLKREKIKKQDAAAANRAGGNESGKPKTGGRRAPNPALTGGESSEGSGGIDSRGNNFVSRGNESGTPDGDGDAAPPADEPAKEKSGDPAPGGQINEVVLLGRPRFMLSGGLVYSPLPRRTFESVKGFTRDAQGNPSGDGSSDIVGFGENSSRRLLPMVLLNSRLLSFKPASLFFSFGVTAKHDDNLDIEYLIGPSVSFLNDRALFTFGAYGGKTQYLVSDVKVGDELPDDVGNAKLFRKSHVWKPGFSFSYSFSSTKKGDSKESAGDGSSSSAADVKSEIRIGNIPFNLAVGMAYTSLEQRTYDAVVGFARDRQGNLTNGQTLTRIVGLTSSSSYRLTPLALLHSRLTNFGKYDFYFTTGISGKKTDDDFDIEYLLGASVNLYRRKVFLTLGTFVGKQQILGGDFFEGARLGTSQGVTTQNRYVWKPAIAFSYDISKIIPGTQRD